GNNITETQQKVIDTLRLDYQTFINSSFLLQGRANEFTLKQPAKRKEVLAAILGLSLYEELEERAKALAAERNNDAARIEELIAGMDTELTQRPQYEAELMESRSELSRVEADLKEKEATLASIQQQQHALETKQEQLKYVESHLGELKADLARWENQAVELRSRIATYETVESKRATIEEGYTWFVQLDAENNALNEKAQQLVSLNEQVSQLDKVVERAQNALLTEHCIIENRLRERQAKADSLPWLESELRAARTQLQSLASREEAMGQKRQRSQELLARVNSLKSTIEGLNADLRQLDEKLDLLTTRDARCPLCDTELGTEGLEKVRHNYQSERTAKSQAIREAKEEVERHGWERRNLESEMARLEPELKADRAAKLGLVGGVEKEIADAQEAAKALVEDQEQLANIEGRLTARDYAPAEQKALAELRTLATALGYDAQRHEDVLKQLRSAAQFKEQWQMLEEASKRRPEMGAELGRCLEAAGDIRRRMEVEEEKHQELAKETARLPLVILQVEEANAACQALTGEEQRHREKAAVIQERLRQMRQLEEDRKARGKARQLSLEEENIFRQLAEAFGKKGIQALLIEQALPEIEREADRLLKRMTDNRMSIKMETQRETKKGSVMETLDIRISDELGTRNYEMFSGGEAFRIDFALRLALSRLLTRRAGASLSTLFIDEGFGTQDNSGRGKLIDVINSVQDDFEKVIVITHLEELKDVFPTRIEVTKTTQGSTISVA
ncbi:MAG: SMC family ATPase, partial [Chloroflexota bacterium]